MEDAAKRTGFQSPKAFPFSFKTFQIIRMLQLSMKVIARSAQNMSL
jgi:hypothetical protein